MSKSANPRIGLEDSTESIAYSGATIRSALRGAKVKFKGGWSWCARRMSADDPSTRFMSMSRKTNKYFHSWCAVLSPSATRATKPEALRAIPP